MFNWRGTIIFTGDDPEFQVRFVGSTETLVASGKGCTKLPVKKLIEECGDERKLRKAVVAVNASGLFLREKDSKRAITDKFDIRYISYCSADTDIHPKLFAWVYKNKAEQQMQCYAVFCSSPEKANLLAYELSKAFHTAYADWKLGKTRQERIENARTRQRSLSTESAKSDKEKRPKPTISCDDPNAKRNSTDSSSSSGSGGQSFETVVRSIGFESSNLLSEMNITAEEGDDSNSVENNSVVGTEIVECD